MAKTTTQKKTSRPLPKAKRTSAPPVRDRGASAAPGARGRLDRVRMPAPALKAVRAEPSSAEDNHEGKYVYCIIKTQRPLAFGRLGIGPDPSQTHTVNYRDIAAVVSNTPMVVQDPTRDN